jgi:hypothetical protein
MIRSVLFALLGALGATDAAQAQAPDTACRVPGGGNVAGDDDRVIQYSQPGAGVGGAGFAPADAAASRSAPAEHGYAPAARCGACAT